MLLRTPIGRPARGAPVANDHPGQRQPAPRCRARRAFHSGPHGNWRPVVRLWAGRPDARGRRGSAAGALRGLFLTHLHSDHTTDLNDVITVALDHLVPAQPAVGVSARPAPPRWWRRPRRCWSSTSATAWPTTPTSAGARPPRPQSRSGASCWRREACASLRRPPTTHRCVPPSATGSTRTVRPS